MDASEVASSRQVHREPAICSTDDDAVIPKREAARRTLDKRSWEYIVKSGLAGGFAGCAVCRVISMVDLFN